MLHKHHSHIHHWIRLLILCLVIRMLFPVLQSYTRLKMNISLRPKLIPRPIYLMKIIKIDAITNTSSEMFLITGIRKHTDRKRWPVNLITSRVIIVCLSSHTILESDIVYVLQWVELKSETFRKHSHLMMLLLIDVVLRVIGFDWTVKRCEENGVRRLRFECCVWLHAFLCVPNERRYRRTSCCDSLSRIQHL